jgi:uncharacterized protein
MSGNFFWYEVITTDVDAARRFYTDVVGWGTQDSGTPGYTLFTVDGRPVAGLMAIPDEARAMGAPPSWMGYVAVNDVDGMAERIVAEGGRLHRAPFDVPGAVRLAVAADPQGANFIVARDLMENPPPALPPGTPGTVGWHELYAADWPPAFAFYEKLFGWTKGEAIDMGPAGTYQLFAAGGAPLGGMMTKPAQVPVPHWLYYFNVAGIDAAAARVTGAGGEIFMGPMEVPGGQWIVNCRDPQGAVFALVALTR